MNYASVSGPGVPVCTGTAPNLVPKFSEKGMLEWSLRGGRELVR